MSSPSLSSSSASCHHIIINHNFHHRQLKENVDDQNFGIYCEFLCCNYNNNNKQRVSNKITNNLTNENIFVCGEKNFTCLMSGYASKFSRQDNMMQNFLLTAAETSTEAAIDQRNVFVTINTSLLSLAPTIIHNYASS
ncbi:hypothetical protein Glove_217g94 [Diversispora epigaea]|uniref:Uncharacterized protein n=1 Tax=Diversispora epigaea TaxID=1348612 RepID=A0A397IQ18_9GLOM|nr:hypothetical protein Glove_217g94 [Diversispora epigaea]